MKYFCDIATYIARTRFFLYKSFGLLITYTKLILSLFIWHLKSRNALAAEIIFLKEQLANFESRKVKPKRATPTQRLVMVWLSKHFNWRNSLRIVKPDTFIRWHRIAYEKYWAYKSKPGRPTIPLKLIHLIRKIQRENPLAGQRMIELILLLKFDIVLSPRTIAKYMLQAPSGDSEKKTTSPQSWSTFIQNHAKAIIAADFMTVVSWNFKTYYVLVILEISSRKIIHTNVTDHPTASWAIQQFREAIPSDHSYKYLIHDRDSIFSNQLNRSVENLGLKIKLTPPRSPKANAFCERVIGTIRRDCLDHMLIFSQNHLYKIMKEYVNYYNHDRPHSSLLNFPAKSRHIPRNKDKHRHHLPSNTKTISRPILGGLHHDYCLKKAA